MGLRRITYKESFKQNRFKVFWKIFICTTIFDIVDICNIIMKMCTVQPKKLLRKWVLYSQKNFLVRNFLVKSK